MGPLNLEMVSQKLSCRSRETLGWDPPAERLLEDIQFSGVATSP